MKARHQVGEVVHVVHFAATDNQFNDMFYMPYMYSMKPVTKISLLKLTVVKHEKVRTDYEPDNAEPTHDGFILQDEAGNIWYNQYPHASYGQVSDEGDRIYTLAVEQPGKPEYESYDTLMKDLGIDFFETYSLTAAMRRIYKGIVDLAEINDDSSPINPMFHLKLDMLVWVYRDTLAMFETEHPGRTIEIIPSKEYPNIIQYARVMDMATVTREFFDVRTWEANSYTDKIKTTYLKLMADKVDTPPVTVNLQHPKHLTIAVKSGQIVVKHCRNEWNGNNLKEVIEMISVRNADSIDRFMSEFITALTGWDPVNTQYQPVDSLTRTLLG